MKQKYTHPLFWLLALLFLKALIMTGVILFAGIGLGPDEAQYWTWSQQLDWGYYSKPPGIAWEIALGCLAFGNSELGVRFLALWISAALALSVYFLARCSGLKTTTSFWAGAIMALCPMGVLSSLLATTDAGFVLFWILALAIFVKAIQAEKAPSYLLIGGLILLGALFKWTIYGFWIVVLVFSLFYPFLRSWKIIPGIAISLLGFIPSVIWNASRHWPTFQHVWMTNIAGYKAVQSTPKPGLHGNVLEFIGAQAALLSPILFLLVCIAFATVLWRRQRMPRAVWTCGLLSLLIWTLYSGIAIFHKMQGNWAVFAFPSAIVFLCWYAFEYVSWGRVWVYIGIAFSVLLTALILCLPYIQSHSLFKKVEVPFKSNPFKECLGWDQLASALTEAGYKPSQHFLFSDHYQMTSELSFYGPEQKRAYFFNLSGSRKNQFSYWPGMAEEQIGKDGFFVYSTQFPQLEKNVGHDIERFQKGLESYFQEVRFIGLKPIFYSYGKMAKGLLIFECRGYNGKEPLDPGLY